MHLIPMSRGRQTGFSLIELAIVLAIVGIIVGGVWLGITTVMQNRIMHQAEEELTLVKNGVIALSNRTAFPNANGAVYLLTPSLITLGIIPSWAVISPTQAGAPWALTRTSSWGGSFFVYVGQQFTTSQFRLSFYYPPSYACVDLLLKATQCNAGSQGCPLNVATDFTQGGATLPDPLTGWQIMTPAFAANLCAQNPSGDGSVEFVYKL